MSEPVFTFQPRWKEELVVTGPGGSFVLELTMGRLCAFLPTEEVWANTAPDWTRSSWSALRAELRDWCIANNAQLCVDPTATAEDCPSSEHSAQLAA